MKITEMKNCIDNMRESYKFDDTKTEINLANDIVTNAFSRTVVLKTIDKNGTEIEMSRRADRMIDLRED